MLILVEGPDGAGKSHLVKQLAQALAERDAKSYPQITVQHQGPPDGHPLDVYERPLFHYRPDTNHHFIADRWHVGEWIYPGVFNRKSHADIAVWRHLDMFLASRGAVIVHLSPPVDRLIENITQRGDDMVSTGQLLGISAGYHAALRASHLPIIKLTDYATAGDVNNIITTAARAEFSAEWLNRFVTYIGPPRPEYLLLGDVRHDLRHTVDTLQPADTVDYGPAFGPYLGTSGHFLLRHLPDELIGRVGIANGCDVDVLDELLHAIGNPYTIALGARAWQSLTRTRLRPVSGARIPHPQYVRRFHSRTDYGQIIRNAARLALKRV